MKKKLLSTILLFGLVSMIVFPLIPMGSAVVDLSSHNSIIVDGEIGTDWTDGNYTVRLDPDSAWDGNWGLEGMYFALNDTGISLGLETLQAGPTDNQFNIFIDVDQGGEGLADYNLAGEASGKNCKFTNEGFIPDFVLLGVGIENWSINAAWKLYEFTDDAGATTDHSGATGYETAVKNHTVFDGSWSYPIDVTYESYIPWDVIYSSGIPADAELRFFAAMIGGEPGDVCPNQYLDVDDTNVEYSNYLSVKVADGDGDPQLIPRALGWPGANADLSYTTADVNDRDGDVTLGLDMIFSYAMWFKIPGTDSAYLDFMNKTEWPLLNYVYYNSTATTNDTLASVEMFHQAGYVDGSNEIFNYIIPLMPADGYAAGDIFYWYITAGELNETTVFHYESEVVPMPPIDIGFVGNIDPLGGFKEPGSEFDVSVQIEQLWNGSSDDRVTFDVGTDVTLNWTLNATAGWNQDAMSYDSVQGQNAQYKITNVGPFAENDTFTFNIIVENNNTVKTSDFNILIIIPPPEEEIFYMTDPQHDEWGTYPWNGAFGGLSEGLFDILNFNVSSNIYQTTFTIELADTYDPGWGGGNFSHQLFLVMVDTEEGGSTEGPLRSYVTVEESHAWDHAFYVDGWMQRYFTPETIDEPQTAAHGITSGYEFLDGNNIYSFNVPETLFGEVANENWSYYVMCGSADFNDFRNHKAVNEEWSFGGGDDGDADPNYCDTLVPAGGNSTEVQEIISSSYDVSTSTRATLLAVGHGIEFTEDTVDPVVAITSPAADSEFTWTSGDVYELDVTWTAEDPDNGTFNGLESVKLYVNGVLVPGTSGGSATVELEAGESVIKVVAYDNSGNYATAEITVTVTDNRSTETETETDTEEGPKIPGYSLGFLFIASIACMLVLLKKYRK